ncbi:thioredoxin-like protein [Coniochaeta sp. 2T2.1]|nr:thioredoxin-like protein [Coniochaeta sp. 2T2.1]
MGSTNKLILYTNHRCPWAHRVHIALNELNIPYDEEIIDLDTPRTEAYLKINPRGLVPTINHDGEIITESGIVAQYLADAHPSSHLLPASNAEGGALRRARVAFFVDAFFSKFHSHLGKFVFAKSDEDASAGVEAAVAGLLKEVEPLLKDAGPFFGGSEKLTLAEVSPDRVLRHPRRLEREARHLPGLRGRGLRREGAQLLEVGSGGRAASQRDVYL